MDRGAAGHRVGYTRVWCRSRIVTLTVPPHELHGYVGVRRLGVVGGHGGEEGGDGDFGGVEPAEEGEIKDGAVLADQRRLGNEEERK